jgi:hypothetical protein
MAYRLANFKILDSPKVDCHADIGPTRNGGPECEAVLLLARNRLAEGVWVAWSLSGNSITH